MLLRLCLVILKTQICRSFFCIQGIYYDDTYENVAELVNYSVILINKQLSSHSLQLDYTINKLVEENSYKLTRIRESCFWAWY